MQLRQFVLLVSISPIYSMVMPLTKPNGDLDPTAVTSHILRLEQTISDLQAESQTKEQKQAAILSSVLSKLQKSEEELLEVKTDLQELKQNYSSTVNSLQRELSDLQSAYNTNSIELRQLKSNLANNSRCLKDVKSDISLINHDITSITNFTKQFPVSANIETQLNSTRMKVTEMKSELTSIQKNLAVALEQLQGSHMKNQKVFSPFLSNSQFLLKNRTLFIGDVKYNIDDAYSSKTGQYVFFSAFVSSDKRMSKNQIVYFRDVRDNIGGAYNSSTGHFIAPVSGLYIFEFSITSSGDGVSEFSIFIQDTAKVSVVGHYHLSHASSIFHANKGDHVYILKTYDLKQQVVQKSCRSHFTGFLLRED